MMESCNHYRYLRKLPTGLGDRLGVYMCLAAWARLKRTSIHLSWTDHRDSKLPWEQWASQDVKKYIFFPSELVFHTQSKLDALEEPIFKWDQGFLPARLAFDCIPHLAWKTYSSKEEVNSFPVEDYLNCYQQVAAEMLVIDPSGFQLPMEKYGVIHIRGRDRGYWTDRESTLTIVKNLSVTTWLVITDDPKSYQFFPEFNQFQLVPIQRDLEGTLRDFNILLSAQVIVQHAEIGWSAFSHIASLVRQVPIINTSTNFQNNIVMNFKKLGGQPDIFYLSNQLSDLQKKLCESIN